MPVFNILDPEPGPGDNLATAAGMKAFIKGQNKWVNTHPGSSHLATDPYDPAGPAPRYAALLCSSLGVPDCYGEYAWSSKVLTTWGDYEGAGYGDRIKFLGGTNYPDYGYGYGEHRWYKFGRYFIPVANQPNATGVSPGESFHQIFVDHNTGINTTGCYQCYARSNYNLEYKIPDPNNGTTGASMPTIATIPNGWAFSVWIQWIIHVYLNVSGSGRLEIWRRKAPTPASPPAWAKDVDFTGDLGVYGNLGAPFKHEQGSYRSAAYPNTQTNWGRHTLITKIWMGKGAELTFSDFEDLGEVAGGTPDAVTPTASPLGSTGLTTPITVYLDTVTPGGNDSIYYTTTGVDPDTGDTLYDPETGIAISADTELRYAVLDLAGYNDSPVGVEVYDFAESVPDVDGIKINCGGEAYGSYVADVHAANGATFGNAGATISGTTDPEKFRWLRYAPAGVDNVTYQLPLTSGDKEITLYWAPHNTGTFVMDIYMGGVLVEASYTVVGLYQAKQLKKTVTVTSSPFEVRCQRVSNGPLINAIDVTELGASPQQSPTRFLLGSLT